MRVRITLDLDDVDRRAIANRHGSVKPAPAADVRSWAESLINETLNDLRDELVQDAGLDVLNETEERDR